MRRLLLVAFFLLAAASASAWPQAGFDAQNSFRSLLHGPKKEPQLRFSIDSTATFAASNLVSRGTGIFLTDIDSVIAVDYATDSVSWKSFVSKSSSGALQFGPVVDETGRVFVQDLQSRVYAFSPTGSLVWQTQAISSGYSFSFLTLGPDHLISSAPVPCARSDTTLVRKIHFDGQIAWAYNHTIDFRDPTGHCILNSENDVYCLITHSSDADLSDLVKLDGTHGQLLWNKTLLGPTSISLWNDELLVIVHFDRNDWGSFESLNAKTGDKIVDQSFDQDTTVYFAGLTRDGLIITYNSVGVLNPVSRIVASHVRTGALKWQVPVVGTFEGSALDANETLFFALRPNQGQMDDFIEMHALDAKTGDQLWNVKATPSYQGSYASGPILLQNGTLALVYNDRLFGWA